MSSLLLGCIADDFTGATDLANNLVRRGLRTVQTIGVPAADAVLQAADADAVVVALKSRTIEPEQAVEQSLQALHWLRARGARQIYFKYCSTFDSTPRGNIGPVTDALLDALGSDFTIACPAFPENQRTVFKGHLFVGDVLLSDSGMRQHPLTPMTDANLVRVLQAQTRRTVGLVPFDVIAQGPAAIRARFDALKAQGVSIAVLDALTDTDLMTIGQALHAMPLVTAGSGIAIGLPQNWAARGELSEGVAADALPAPGGLQAIVSGSCSVATLGQIADFRARGGAVRAVDPLALAGGTDSTQRIIEWAAPLLARGPVLIYASAEPAAVQAVQAKLGVQAAGALVEHTLAEVACSLVAQGVRQLVVAGGETSGAVVAALQVREMAIGAQIDPGVPWTAAASPQCGAQPLHLALKSGNFGAADFFTRAFSRLRPT